MLKFRNLFALLFLVCVVACSDKTFTDERDGKKYRYAKIGLQIWMTENLNYDFPSRKCYDDEEEMCDKHGSLYDWEMAKKVCPNGWHLPHEAEWQELEDFMRDKNAEDYNFTAPELSGWWGSSVHPSDFEYSSYVNSDLKVLFTSPLELYFVRCIKTTD